MSMETLSEQRCFGGTVGYYRHQSQANQCAMQFAVFVPPQAELGPVPVLTYLSGLTCTEETFFIKAGAQRLAAELGLMLVAPDTSPRGEGVPDDPDSAYDFGLGAGFYVDATREPWSANYSMYTYVTLELPQLLASEFPADLSRQGIFGHSMGGHGALVLGLRNPDRYQSISAFAPIVAPSQCPWGEKALSKYLGEEREQWANYDATALVAQIADTADRPRILIDQGLSDQFLEGELHPHLFKQACAEVGYPLELRRHAGYDHGYYFIASFVADHLRHHALALSS